MVYNQRLLAKLNFHDVWIWFDDGWCGRVWLADMDSAVCRLGASGSMALATYFEQVVR